MIYTFNLLVAVIGEIFFRIKAWIEGVPYDQIIAPWQDAKQHTHYRMKRIADMSDGEMMDRWIDKAYEVNGASKAKAEAITKLSNLYDNKSGDQAEEKPRNEKDLLIYSNGLKFYANSEMRELVDTCKGLKNTSHSSFMFFKENYNDKEGALLTLGDYDNTVDTIKVM